MNRFGILGLLFLSLSIGGYSAAKHPRDCSRLPAREKRFSEELSIRQRRIFCGRFNHTQREMTINYAKGRGKQSCFTPDEAVFKVMEETGMSITVKSQRELERR